MLPITSPQIQLAPGRVIDLAHIRHARLAITVTAYCAPLTQPAFLRSPSTTLRSAALIFV